MNFYISQFSKVKTFSENILPISTAVYDPKWYHDNTHTNKVFVDSRGVINGTRLECLSPQNMDHADDCSVCGDKRGNCSFLKSYSEHLHSLDFEKIKALLEKVGENYNKDICLLVYEAPKDPCSERHGLISWFKENGVELKEL